MNNNLIKKLLLFFFFNKGSCLGPRLLAWSGKAEVGASVRGGGRKGQVRALGTEGPGGHNQGTQHSPTGFPVWMSMTKPGAWLPHRIR